MELAQKLQNERMRDLASRPNTSVYDFAFDKPVAEVPPLSAAQLALEAFERRMELKQMGDEEARFEIIKDKSQLTFCKTHPAIFKLVTGPEAKKNLDFIINMAKLRDAVNKESLSETNAMLSLNQAMMSACARNPTKEESERIAKGENIIKLD